MTPTFLLNCLIGFATAANGPEFELHAVEGELRVGPLQRIDRDGSILLSQGPALAGDQLVSLKRLGRPLPAWPRTAHAVLHGGDRIVGQPVEVDGPILQFQPASFKRMGDANEEETIRLPLTSLAFLWLLSPQLLDGDRYAAVLGDTRMQDAVILRNGDVLTGSVISISAKKKEVTLENGTAMRSIDWKQVVGIAFSTQLARTRKPVNRYAHAVLQNGDRLTLQDVEARDGVLSGATLYRDRVAIPLIELAALDIYQGKAVYLSDLKPLDYQYRTDSGEQYSWSADRSLDRRELQIKSPIGAQSFDKGIALHGACKMRYALDQKYQRFEAIVGLDPILGKKGSVDIHIEVDGKVTKMGSRERLTGEAGPWRVNVDVSGGKEMTIVIDWGEGGAVGDVVNWGDARLIPMRKK